MLWLKAWHIIFMVTWFAALFYLPRLFVYHVDAKDAPSIKRFNIMQRRLYLGIMTPGGLLTTATGAGLLIDNPMLLHSRFMQVKLLLVAILWAYHLLCGRYCRAFANKRNTHSSVFYRCFNEVPTVILIAVVILIVVKPF